MPVAVPVRTMCDYDADADAFRMIIIVIIIAVISMSIPNFEGGISHLEGDCDYQ